MYLVDTLIDTPAIQVVLDDVMHVEEEEDVQLQPSTKAEESSTSNSAGKWIYVWSSLWELETSSQGVAVKVQVQMYLNFDVNVLIGFHFL